VPQLDDLEASASYRFAVAAENEVGAGNYSDVAVYSTSMSKPG